MQSKRLLLRGLIGVAVLAFVFAGLSRISFNIEILKLLPTNLRQVEGLSLFLKYFSLPNELIITIDAPDADTAEAAADGLAEHLGARRGSREIRRSRARLGRKSRPSFPSFLAISCSISRPSASAKSSPVSRRKERTRPSNRRSRN